MLRSHCITLLMEAKGKKGAQVPFTDHCIACMCVGGGEDCRTLDRCSHLEGREQTARLHDGAFGSPHHHPRRPDADKLTQAGRYINHAPLQAIITLQPTLALKMLHP